MEESKVGSFWQRKAVLLYLLAQSGVALVAAFGFDMSGEQVTALMAFVNIVIAIFADTMVVPVSVSQARVEQALNTPVPEKVVSK